MSLFDNLNQYETPADAPAPKQQECSSIIKNTRSGHRIMICTIEPAPEAIVRDAAAQNLALFVPREINALAGADPEAVNAAIMAKLALPCTIIDHTDKVSA